MPKQTHRVVIHDDAVVGLNEAHATHVSRQVEHVVHALAHLLVAGAGGKGGGRAGRERHGQAQTMLPDSPALAT